MKNIMIILILMFGTVSTGLGQTSKDNEMGSWTDGNSWVGGQSPPVTNIAGININIYGYIHAGSYGSPQALVFGGNSESNTITVKDTLVIYGNVEFPNKSMLLAIEGVMIVLGDLTLGNKANITSNGILVVQGTLTKVGGQGEYSGEGDVYAGEYNDKNFVPDEHDKNLDPDLGDDYPEIDDFVDNDGIIPLPVDLLIFAAENINNQVQLAWSTASEENFDFFAVERSADGNSFEAIGTIKGKGNSQGIKEYIFWDQEPFQGVSYYRLKSVDFDGYTEYFKIVSVFTPAISQKFVIYPNPSNGHHLVISSNAGKNRVKIVNNTGKQVHAQALHSGENYLDFNGRLPKGLYFVIIDTEGASRRTKLVVE